MAVTWCHSPRESGWETMLPPALPSLLWALKLMASPLVITIRYDHGLPPSIRKSVPSPLESSQTQASNVPASSWTPCDRTTSASSPVPNWSALPVWPSA